MSHMQLVRGIFAALAIIDITILLAVPENFFLPALLLGLLLAVVALEGALLRPLARLGRNLARLARGERASPGTNFCLAEAGRAVMAVQARLDDAAQLAAEQSAAALHRLDAQTRRLEAILLDLAEGVLVCGLDHRLTLFNQAAFELLAEPHALGLGRPVTALLSPASLAAQLDRLIDGAPSPGPAFLCLAFPAARPLRARMGLLRGEDGAAEGYVVTLAPWQDAADAAVETHSADLAMLMRGQLGPQRLLAEAGLPDTVLADAPALATILVQVASYAGGAGLTLAVERRDGLVALDLSWAGAPGAGARWLAETGGEVVLRRLGVVWQAPRDESVLRLSLPGPNVTQMAAASRHWRPEFYEFDLPAAPLGAVAEQKLRDLSYVVFDLETTGLELSKGDVPVSVGAVRVVNRRVRPLERFERLVDPGRPIPPVSTAIHGITDEMVRGKPPFVQVLPAFARFAEGTILVAHNAAFDMLALSIAARPVGLAFDQPVIDTLLISAWLDPEETEHALDAIAARLGLPVGGRHDAMADALLTAAILVRQIERAEARGVTTLGELLAETGMVGRLRANQTQF